MWMNIETFSVYRKFGTACVYVYNAPVLYNLNCTTSLYGEFGQATDLFWQKRHPAVLTCHYALTSTSSMRWYVMSPPLATWRNLLYAIAPA